MEKADEVERDFTAAIALLCGLYEAGPKGAEVRGAVEQNRTNRNGSTGGLVQDTLNHTEYFGRGVCPLPFATTERAAAETLSGASKIV